MGGWEEVGGQQACCVALVQRNGGPRAWGPQAWGPQGRSSGGAPGGCSAAAWGKSGAWSGLGLVSQVAEEPGGAWSEPEVARHRIGVRGQPQAPPAAGGGPTSPPPPRVRVLGAQQRGCGSGRMVSCGLGCHHRVPGGSCFQLWCLGLLRRFGTDRSVPGAGLFSAARGVSCAGPCVPRPAGAAAGPAAVPEDSCVGGVRVRAWGGGAVAMGVVGEQVCEVLSSCGRTCVSTCDSSRGPRAAAFLQAPQGAALRPPCARHVFWRAGVWVLSSASVTSRCREFRRRPSSCSFSHS